MTEEENAVTPAELVEAFDRGAMAGLWIVSPDDDRPFFRASCPCGAFLDVPRAPWHPASTARRVDAFAFRHIDHELSIEPSVEEE